MNAAATNFRHLRVNALTVYSSVRNALCVRDEFAHSSVGPRRNQSTKSLATCSVTEKAARINGNLAAESHTINAYSRVSIMAIGNVSLIF